MPAGTQIVRLPVYLATAALPLFDGIVDILTFEAESYRQRGDALLSAVSVTLASAAAFFGHSFPVLLAMATLLLPKIGRRVFIGAAIAILAVYALRLGMTGMASLIFVDPFSRTGEGVATLIEIAANRRPEHLKTTP